MAGAAPALRRAAATRRPGGPRRRRSSGRGGTTDTTAEAAAAHHGTTVAEAEVGTAMTGTMAGIRIVLQIGLIQDLGHQMMVLGSQGKA